MEDNDTLNNKDNGISLVKIQSNVDDLHDEGFYQEEREKAEEGIKGLFGNFVTGTEIEEVDFSF